MKIFCHPDNLNSLKLLIAKEIGGVANVALESVHPETKVVPYLTSPVLPVLRLDNGEFLFSENAACAYLFIKAGEPPLKPNSEVQLDFWLEWEMMVLRKDVNDVSSVSPHLQSLNGALSSTHLIREDGLTAADVVVWVTLHRQLGDKTLWDESSKAWDNLDHLKKWYFRLENHPAFKTAIEKLSSAPRPDKPYNVIEEPRKAPTFAEQTKKTNLKEASKTAKAASPVAAKVVEGCCKEEPKDDATPEEIDVVLSSWQPTCSHPDPTPPTKLKDRVHPILPKEGRNILITSALPYVNNVPHLGNIIGCVLSADVFSRYCRLTNENVVYVCGTDEYGTATETKAMEEGLTPQEICDKYNAIHKSIYDWFGVSFDHFGRTTTPQQTAIAQDMFWKLYNKGLILKEAVDQLHCGQCDKFLADRFVEGICPFPGCGFEDARGDQCDKCGKLINATELKSPRCKICNSPPSIKTSNHLFLDLPTIEPQLKEHLDKVFEAGQWTSNAKLITKSWLRDGLKPRCITRDLKWGTPVPLEGYQDKVFYVWFDAPIGYLSITSNYAGDAWEAWWKNPSQVELFQFMAKDNVPFHSVIFPSSQLGANDGYTVVNHLVATEYLNYEEGKFSKSRGVGVFGTDAKDTGIPSDIWRFYLLYVRPEGQDSAFNWVDFATKNNSELLNNLGNFLNRPFPFIVSKYDGAIPPYHLESPDINIIAQVNRELVTYHQLLSNIKLRDAIRTILAISAIGNKYIQDNQPWKLLKGSPTEQQRAATVIAIAANLGALLALLLGPYMPDTSSIVLNQVIRLYDQESKEELALPKTFVPMLKEGHKIGTPTPLFKKIELEQVEELKRRFAGQAPSPKATTPVAAPSVTAAPASKTASPEEVARLTAEVTKQGEVVRDLKANKAAKAEVDAQVAILLDLKKQLTAAGGEVANNKGKDDKKKQKQPPQAKVAPPKEPTPAPAGPVDEAEVTRLTVAVTAQGEAVREVKGRRPAAPKETVDSEIAKLLELKKQLAIASGLDPDAAAGGKKKKKK